MLIKLFIIYVDSANIFIEIIIRIAIRIIAVRIIIRIATRITTRIAAAMAGLLLGYRWYILDINGFGLEIRTYFSIAG
jgi:hypothetical protein